MEKNERDRKERISFDDILKAHIGEFGLYQRCMFALLLCVSVTVAFQSFIHAFTGVSPGFVCERYINVDVTNSSIKYYETTDFCEWVNIKNAEIKNLEAGRNTTENRSVTTQSTTTGSNSSSPVQTSVCAEYAVDSNDREFTIVTEVRS